MGNNILKSKKFKYGSLSVVFICVFIALIIAINLIVSLLDMRYDWRYDLTEKQLYSLSEDTDKALKVALGDKYTSFDITVTFCDEKDVFEYYDALKPAASKYYSGVRDIAEEYAKFYNGEDGKGKITVQYINIKTQPAKANELKQQARLDTINWNNIIIQNNNDMGYYRVIGFDACYFSNSDGSLRSLQAENKFTAAIIQCVAAENITVAFTTGHGESDNTGRLEEIFTLATLNVMKIDLKKQEIPDDVQIVVVYDPQYDFTYGEDGEIDKLSDYMSDKTTYKSLMVFVDADTPDLPNLRDYLNEEWGLNYLPNHRITDEEYSVKGSGFNAVIGQYSEGVNNSAAYVLHKDSSSVGLDTVLNNAVELTANTTGFSTKYVEVSVTSHNTAVSSFTENGELCKKTGSFPLIAIATVHSYANDDFNYNANKYQYVILFGSTDFASSKWLNNSYGNENIVYTATRVLATDRVQLDIEEKKFESTALTLESGNAERLMILITCVFPAIIVIVGIAVFFRRRHL